METKDTFSFIDEKKNTSLSLPQNNKHKNDMKKHSLFPATEAEDSSRNRKQVKTEEERNENVNKKLKG